jgi:putative ATPase
VSDLFTHPDASSPAPSAANAPLAQRMRPRTLDEYVGQEHILGPGKLLRRAIEADRISSIILSVRRARGRRRWRRSSPRQPRRASSG